jgi:hypothetical protein
MPGKPFRSAAEKVAVPGLARLEGLAVAGRGAPPAVVELALGFDWAPLLFLRLLVSADGVTAVSSVSVSELMPNFGLLAGPDAVLSFAMVITSSR